MCVCVCIKEASLLHTVWPNLYDILKKKKTTGMGVGVRGGGTV